MPAFLCQVPVPQGVEGTVPTVTDAFPWTPLGSHSTQGPAGPRTVTSRARPGVRRAGMGVVYDLLSDEFLNFTYLWGLSFLLLIST